MKDQSAATTHFGELPTVLVAFNIKLHRVVSRETGSLYPRPCVSNFCVRMSDVCKVSP